MRRHGPLSLLVPAAIGVGFLAMPLVAVLVKAPWHSLLDLVTSPASRTALRLSIECSAGALALSLLLGVPLAWVLARLEFPGKAVLRALVLVPLVLPPVVGGVALLLAFGRHGLVPLHIAFTTRAAILAEGFVALPFLVLSVEGALLAMDREYEEVAATLGSRPFATFRRVTVPLVAPALAAGGAPPPGGGAGGGGATGAVAGRPPGGPRRPPGAGCPT